MASLVFRAATACAVLVALLLTLSPQKAFAQVATATVSGSVTDSTGALVPNAAIVLREENTGAETQAKADKDGSFQIPSVPVGRYDVTVTAQGFNIYSVRGIPLAVNQALTLPVKLAVSAQQTTVTVEANQVAVDAQTTSVQSEINQQQVSELPLNGRNPAALIFTVAGASNPTGPPGASNASLSVNSSLQNYPGTTAVSIHGSRTGGVYFALDGGTNTDPLQVLGGPFPNPDATAEFSVQTATYGARYISAPGGAVNIITRSGTNQIHGSVFEFIRNGAVNARNYFSGGLPDNLKRNQFGVSAGGPIMKDRWFVFGSYQGTRTVSQTISVDTLPTAAQRNGTFSGFLVDPITFFTPLPYNAATNTTQIPANLLSPVNQNLLKLIPVPTSANGSYTAVVPSRLKEDQYVAKTDYHWGNHTSFLRYFGTFYSSAAVGDPTTNLVTTAPGTVSQFQNATIGDTWVHHNIINDFRVTYLYDDFQQSFIPTAPSYASLGSKVTPSTVHTAFTLIGGTTAGGPLTTAGSKQVDPRHNIDVADNVDITKGQHTLSFGTEIQQIHAKVQSNAAQDPIVLYFGVSGNPIADFILGAPTVFNQSDGSFSLLTGTLYGFHAQDQYKFGRGTVLTAGLRYDPYFPFSSDNNGVNCYIQGHKSGVYTDAPAGLNFPGDPGCTSSGTYHRLGLVQPRIGIAHQIDSAGKTSVRAGYGVYTMQVPLYELQSFATSFPFVRTFTLGQPGVSIDNPWANYPGGDPFAATGYRTGATPAANITFPVVPSISSISSNFTPANTQQWSLSVQHLLTKDDIIEVAYVGTKGTHLILNYNLNTPVFSATATASNEQARRPDQNFSLVSQVRSDGVSSYNGLSVSYHHSQGRSLFIDSEFNFQKAMDDYSVPGQAFPGSAAPQQTLFHGFRYGPSDFNQPLTWRNTVVLNTPSLKDMSLGMRELIGDWSLNGIYSMEAGFPLTVTSGVDGSLTGLNTDFADRVPNTSAYLSTPGNKRNYLNPAAFTANATGTFGDLGRNSIQGPGSIDLDIGIMKQFPIRDAIGLTLRFESFNTLNRANFFNPQTVLNSGTFGQLNAAHDPRILQASGRITF